MATDYTKIKAWQIAKELGYLDTNKYEELWAKAQVGSTRNREGLRILQGLISYIERSGV